MQQAENTSSTISRRLHKKGLTILLSAAFILILAGLGVQYYLAHRYVPGKITFQEYAPQYLPEGVKVKATSIYAWRIPGGMPERFTSIRSELTSGFVDLSNNRNFDYKCRAVNIANVTCSNNTTSTGKHYILTTTVYAGDTYNRQVNQQMEWLESGTDVMVSLDSKNGTQYSQEALNKMIDSFKPTQFKNLPVHYIDKSSV